MITIIDYKAGNLASVKYALERLGAEYEITSEQEKICQASKIIFPGVGHARDAMQNLAQLGLVKILQNISVPFLGICLGMQIMYEYSAEGDTKCLGLLPGKIQKFEPTPDMSLKIPHMGWNNISQNKESSLLAGIKEEDYFYFVHSYYAPINDVTCAIANYICDFACAVHYKNFYGVQFHPEKSGEVGERVLKNFLEI